MNRFALSVIIQRGRNNKRGSNVITYQQIGEFLQQTQRLSASLRDLNRALVPVMQLSERLGRMDVDLAVQQEVISHEIRSMEVLGDLLRKCGVACRTSREDDRAEEHASDLSAWQAGQMVHTGR